MNGRLFTMLHPLHPIQSIYSRSFRSTVVAASAAPYAKSTTTQSASVPKPGDLLTLKCTEITTGGGLCKLDNGFVIFVDKALPGERLTARITKVNKKSWAQASKIETLHPHSNAVEPQCPHFGTCGGCSLQSLSYEAQLEAKQKRVTDVFRKIGGIQNIDEIVQPAIGSAAQYHYRNKVEFSFSSTSTSSDVHVTGQQRGSNDSGSGSNGSGAAQKNTPTTTTIKTKQQQGEFIVGLHAPGCHNTIVPIDRCELQSEIANIIYTETKELLHQYGFGAYERPPPRYQQQNDNRQRGGDKSYSNNRRSSSRSSTFNTTTNKYSNDRRSDTPTTTTSTNDTRIDSTNNNILQHLVIRQGTSSSTTTAEDNSNTTISPTYLINIVTSRDARKELTPLATTLANSLLQASQQHKIDIVGIVNTVSQSGTALEQRKISEQHILWGQDHLITHLNGLNFRVSPTSFSQVNTEQAQVLYKKVVEAAGVQPGDTVLDLFCGTGTLTCLLAQQANNSQVWGVDISPSAIEDARINAKLNLLTDDNVKFLCGDVGKLLPALLGNSSSDTSVPSKPDVVLTDPARSGMSGDVVSFLKKCGARRIVYVSCDCGTQARDIKALLNNNSSDNSSDGEKEGEKGEVYRYELKSVTPVDLFPQTFHVETVAVLDRID